MSDVQITITPQAECTMNDMERRVRDIATAYGEGSPEHIAVLQSLIQALRSVMRLGGHISRDGELSLLGVSWITYGVIWHAKYIEGNKRDPLLGDWSTHS